MAQSRARQLPFADRSVDGIATSGTLIHLGPPDMLRAALEEFARVSRRWFFFIELWAQEPTLMVFGNLLPPAWAYPWDQNLLNHLPGWVPRHTSVHKMATDHNYDVSSIAMILMERRQG